MSRRSGSSTPAKRVYLTEVPEETVDEPADAEPDVAEDDAESSLEAAIQREAQAFATELEDAEQDGMDPAALEALEANFESAAETLVTMREARTRLQEIRKDRGYKKADGKTGNPSKKNAKHPCFDCGLPGHWAGDKECQKPGQGLAKKGVKAAIKQVRFTEVCASDVDPTTLADDGAPIHEASMVLHSPGLSLDQALHANIYGTSHPVMLSDARNLSKDKMLVGALDSACNRTCTGPKWLEAYTARLRESAPPFVTELIQEITEHENFRFGNGGVVPSTHRWRIPAFVGGRVLLIWVSLVPVPSLGLLLGRDFLESVGGVLDFADKTISFKHLEAETQRLEQMSAGHYMLPLLAELWPRLPVLRWKRCGLDGIIELQMSSEDWLHRCLTDKQNELKTTSKQVSDHFLTEHFNEYVFSGPPAQSKTADVPMSSSAFQTHIVESFCDECLRSPNSVTAMAVGSPGCERDNQAPEACGSKDVLRGDRVLRPNLVPLEKIHPSRPRASSLARTKFALWLLSDS